jgi:hypothetical protein
MARPTLSMYTVDDAVLHGFRGGQPAPGCHVGRKLLRRLPHNLDQRRAPARRGAARLFCFDLRTIEPCGSQVYDVVGQVNASVRQHRAPRWRSGGEHQHGRATSNARTHGCHTRRPHPHDVVQSEGRGDRATRTIDVKLSRTGAWQMGGQQQLSSNRACQAVFEATA